MSQFSFGPANEQIPNATTSASGLMSATDKTKLDGISQSTMRDVPFAVAVADWTLSSGVYSAEFTSAYITASSKEIATYEANYRDYAKASISIDKKSGGGGMIFTTSVIPTGTITGHLYVWDNDDSKVPVLIEDTVVSIANGGTGQSSLAGVKSAFGIDTLNAHINEIDANIGALVTLGSSNSAGEVTLSESYRNFELVGIQVTNSAIYSPMLIVPSEFLVYQTEGIYRLAIICYNMNTNAVSVCRVWHVSNTKLNVRDACSIYGIIRK